MAYNDKNMVNDYSGHKIPQYYNPVTDKYEPLHGADNVSFVGNHVLSDSGIWLPVSATNPMHVKNNELENKIDNLEAKIDSVIENGSINTRLTGSNVEVKTLVNARALTEATNYFDIVDLSKYKSFDLRITNTHDVNIRLGFRDASITTIHLINKDDGSKMAYNPYSGNQYASHLIPAASSFIYLSQIPLRNTTKPLPYKDYNDLIALFYQPTTKPTYGSITIEVVGVLR